ncbi:MAG: hypothetical protein FJ096_07760 [Deltaproteobacteria bacterium]|nr:hypothetical protein [Deltaproteobacteria bacterium]
MAGPRRATLSLLAAVSVALGIGLVVNGCQLLSGVSDMQFATASATVTSTASGGAGGTGGAPGTGGAGGEVPPPPCEQASDCPPSANPCEAPICIAKQCGFVAVSAGSKAALSAQTEGDCRELVCNGDGQTVEKVDDGDVPNDGSDCTEDGCVDGTPITKPKPFGTSCGEGASGKCDDAGTCQGCLADVDCGAPTECATPTCVSGSCAAGFLAANTVLANQAPGDCVRRVCDGSGKVTDEPDDADLPNDGNDCTDDVCTMGVPSNPPSAKGLSCGNAAAMTCDGNGGCNGCAKAADCAGTDDACRTRTCIAGTCGIAKQPAGTKLPAGDQTVGDCKAKACTDLGLVADVPDDDPPPEDGNPCTLSACVEGAPAHPPAPQAMACNVAGGKVCNGSGSCVACNAALDCDLAVGTCQLKACVANACAVANAPNNEPAAPELQKAGDCQIVRCDGKGGTTSQPLDADIPLDGLPCTQDLCVGGKPSNPPEPAGAACQSGSGGKKCDGKGVCVRCLVDADCKGGSCIAGACNNCQAKSCLDLGLTCGQTTDGCGGDLLCADQSKNGLETAVDCGGDPATCPTRCTNGSTCLADADCQSGHCEQGVCCNVACDGACKSCRASDTGGKDGQCGFVTKGSDPLAQCGLGKLCDGSGACKASLGQACAAGAECASGFCPTQDGVCCATACAGVCESCSAKKTGDVDGDCGPVVADSDPDNECVDQGAASCGKSGVCDGALLPACRLYAAGTVCKAGACDAAQLKQTAPSTCNGSGTCDPGATTSCNGFLCGVGACKTTCVTDVDCATGYFCGQGGVCTAKKGQGVACGGDKQCSSGFCRDGVCCNTTCGGTCSACSAAKTGLANGTCGFVTFATDPDNECGTFTPLCSGAGACTSCGMTLQAPGGVCPNECTGGCNNTTQTCTIACDKTDGQCENAALVCPAGWNCNVLCARKAACKSATVTCPGNYRCDVGCTNDAESCANLSMLCKNGNCNLACNGGSAKDTCTGAQVSCGSNACAATCGVGYLDATKYPKVLANGSCSCVGCGGSACL